VFAAAVATAARGVADGAAEDPAAGDWSRIYLGSSPSVSPDGAWFVFEWCDSVWKAPTAGGEAVRLTRNESTESWPRLSPDGKRVAFLSSRDGGVKIHEMDLATRGVRRVSIQDEYMNLCGWTPDGKSVIASTRHADDAPKKAYRIAFVSSADGRETQPFANVVSSFGAVSPDGRKIAFSRRGENIYRKRKTGKMSLDAEIWIYDIPSKKFEKAATKSDNAFFPVWRPDGKAFYYLGRRPGAHVHSVREYALDGGADREVLSFGDDAAMQPTLSADGRTMIVRAGFDFWRFDPVAAKPRPARIVMHAGTEQERREVARRRFYTNAWNNDGSGDVTFCRNGTQFAFTCGGGLYAMDEAAQTSRLVAERRLSRAVECAFTRDGSRLYALFDSGDATEICYFTRKDPSLAWWENSSFECKTVAAGEAARRNLSVSPDGSRIAWCDALGTLYFADPEGVVKGKGPETVKCGSYAWSPDARYVAASLCDEYSNYEVWIVSTDGSREPYNITRNWKWDGDCAWSPDGKIIAWVGSKPESSRYDLRYVYVDPADENEEKPGDKIARSRRKNAETAPKEKGKDKKDDDGKKEKSGGKGGYNIVFDGLCERVRETGLRASNPFFSHDSRTIAFDSGSCTDKVKIPNEMNAKRLSSKRGRAAVWFKDGDRVAWAVDNKPALLDNVFNVSVYREDDLADYRELAFRTAWARIRDKFYDRNCHGTDWPAVRAKYVLAARNAASYSVFTRVINMMLGELDASHLGFWSDSSSDREWVRKPTLHNWSQTCGDIGVRFEPGTFKVASIIEDSPADGVLALGDEITAVDGVPLRKGDCFDDRLVVPSGGAGVQLTLKHGGEGDSGKPIYIKPVPRSRIRELVREAKLKENRRKVHEATKGKVGYLHIDKMGEEDYRRFEAEIFSECWGKDAVIIDVRGNTGGYVADRVLSVICSGEHSKAVPPGGQAGYLLSYWRKPVFHHGGVVVLIDEEVFSNGEIFAHAVKALKRGVLVGRQTAGAVIATTNNPLLDFGTFRDAFWGWFCIDGKDMENNGAMPDVEVDITPADEEAGRDPQLDAAVREALAIPPPKPFKPVYAK